MNARLTYNPFNNITRLANQFSTLFRIRDMIVYWPLHAINILTFLIHPNRKIILQISYMQNNLAR
jgi:hypothetical protein